MSGVGVTNFLCKDWDGCIVNPITLEPVQVDFSLPYLNFRSGGLSNKNSQETAHFLKAYSPQSPEASSYARRIKVLPNPDTAADSVILDIGCGPYDCISAIPGCHIFLDDIMDAYVDKLNTNHNGLRLCARTELMPIRSASVDLIYSINMIDHVDDMPETLFEMHRVLKNGARVYLQTYFNSHPLLETEPGIFDRYFLDTYVRPYFDLEVLRTFAVGDPAISEAYTMDILAAVLVKREKGLPPRKARDRYLDAEFLGPQSLISTAIGLLKAGGSVDEILPKMLGDKCYDIHMAMLHCWNLVNKGDFGGANGAIKALGQHPRVKRNPFARIALLTIENRRIALASVK